MDAAEAPTVLRCCRQKLHVPLGSAQGLGSVGSVTASVAGVALSPSGRSCLSPGPTLVPRPHRHPPSQGGTRDVTCTAAGGGDAAAWPSAPPPSAPPGPPCRTGRRCAWPFQTERCSPGQPCPAPCVGQPPTRAQGAGEGGPWTQTHLRSVRGTPESPGGCWGGTGNHCDKAANTHEGGRHFSPLGEEPRVVSSVTCPRPPTESPGD